MICFLIHWLNLYCIKGHMMVVVSISGLLVTVASADIGQLNTAYLADSDQAEMTMWMRRLMLLIVMF